MLEKPLTANGTTTTGRTEPVLIHFEDLDAMGVAYNARYVRLLERALAAYWPRAGWPFDPATLCRHPSARRCAKHAGRSYVMPAQG